MMRFPGIPQQSDLLVAVDFDYTLCNNHSHNAMAKVLSQPSATPATDTEIQAFCRVLRPILQFELQQRPMPILWDLNQNPSDQALAAIAEFLAADLFWDHLQQYLLSTGYLPDALNRCRLIIQPLPRYEKQCELLARLINEGHSVFIATKNSFPVAVHTFLKAFFIRQGIDPNYVDRIPIKAKFDTAHGTGKAEQIDMGRQHFNHQGGNSRVLLIDDDPENTVPAAQSGISIVRVLPSAVHDTRNNPFNFDVVVSAAVAVKTHPATQNQLWKFEPGCPISNTGPSLWGAATPETLSTWGIQAVYGTLQNATVSAPTIANSVVAVAPLPQQPQYNPQYIPAQGVVPPATVHDNFYTMIKPPNNNTQPPQRSNEQPAATPLAATTATITRLWDVSFKPNDSNVMYARMENVPATQATGNNQRSQRSNGQPAAPAPLSEATPHQARTENIPTQAKGQPVVDTDDNRPLFEKPIHYITTELSQTAVSNSASVFPLIPFINSTVDTVTSVKEMNKGPSSLLPNLGTWVAHEIQHDDVVVCMAPSYPDSASAKASIDILFTGSNAQKYKQHFGVVGIVFIEGISWCIAIQANKLAQVLQEAKQAVRPKWW